MFTLRRSIRRLLLTNALVLALGALGAGSPASGQVASLVRDLAPGDIFGGHSLEPGNLYGAGPRLYFFADLGDLGQNPSNRQTGLWVSDGTAGGTQPLAKVCSIDCTNRFLGSLDDVVFFLGGDGNLDHLLWRSDGTRAGTYPLNEAGPELNPIFDVQGKYAFFGGFLYFVEESLGGGTERLWRTDGTIEGTQLVADITPTAFAVRHLGSLTPFHDRLYFLGPRHSDGYPVVWRSDGTSAGTAPLSGAPSFSSVLAASDTHLFFDGDDPAHPGIRQLWTTDGNSAPSMVTHMAAPALERTGWIAIANGRALFIAQNGNAGQELWTSDGTAAGTRAMTNFASAMPFANGLSLGPRMAATAGNRVVFEADGGIWSSAGTPQSTVEIHDRPAAFASSLTAVGDRVVFYSGTAPDEGVALWSTDGTPGGTRSLEPTCGAFTICPDPVVRRVGDRLYYAVTTDVDWFLHETDGTAAGTKPFEPAVGGSFLRFTVDIAAFDRGLAFPKNDDDGLELWVKADAAASVARKLTEVSGPQSSYPSNMSTTGILAFFHAASGSGNFPVLWQSDGSAVGTIPVPNVDGFAASPVVAAGKVFYLSGRDLWRADGTASGTIQLTSFSPDQYTDSEPLVPYRSGVAFVVSSPAGFAIWTSDGTSAGTEEMVPPPALPDGTEIDRLLVAGDELFFVVTNPTTFVSKIWRASTTPGGTQEIAPVRNSFDPQVTAVGGSFYFVASPELGSTQLWRTDGSTAGTEPVRSNGEVVSGFGIDELTAAGGKLFFATHNPDRLWRSDGTEAGTFAVKSLDLVENLVGWGSLVLFVADDGAHGRELWVSDGTAAGTRMVRDVWPGPEGSRPLELTPAPGRLYFTAEDGVHGRELWQTDGTLAGTRLVQDIWPGPGSSSPSELTAGSSRLFFSANDGLTGYEPWSLLYAASGACVSSETAMCLQGGRYRVEAFWHDFAGNSGRAHAVALTPDSGYFWFFDAANVEVVLKVLDGSPVNGHAWVFFGSLSSVHYTVTVTDTQTLAARRYVNPSGTLASVADTDAFGPRGAKRASRASTSAAPYVTSTWRAGSGKGAAQCTAGPTRLCLQQGRFAVEVAWRDFAGGSGVGTASPLTTDTGSFWFFSPSNVELMVKVLDGRSVNGKFWVFFAALSTVEYTVTVTDTATGAQRVYVNPSGQLASIADTNAF